MQVDRGHCLFALVGLVVAFGVLVFWLNPNQPVEVNLGGETRYSYSVNEINPNYWNSHLGGGAWGWELAACFWGVLFFQRRWPKWAKSTSAFFVGVGASLVVWHYFWVMIQ